MVTLNDLPPLQALVELAHDFHARGWMAGTAGNLSLRAVAEVDSFWITASGLPKGRLNQEDMLRIAVADGVVLEAPRADRKPSAETTIHQAIYQQFPQVRACLHVHSVDANLACIRLPAPVCEWPLPPLEMLKGLGIWEEAPQVSLPVFTNHLSVPLIAEDIATRFSLSPPRVPALMIRNHGLTVWGDNAQQAYDRLEIAEFIMSYLARV